MAKRNYLVEGLLRVSPRYEELVDELLRMAN
jgi:hypothetical protein